MAKPEVMAKDVMKDIRSGMSNAELREKYHLSDKGLHSLFTKLIGAGILAQEAVDGRFNSSPAAHSSAAKPQSQQGPRPSPASERKAPPPAPPKPQKEETDLDLKKVANDLLSGMEDAELMKKYGVRPDGLEPLFNKLLEAGLLTEEEFYERILQAESEVVTSPTDTTSTPVTRPKTKERREKQLILAAKDGKVDRVVMHLKQGADADGRDEFGDTAILVAADAGHHDVVKMLIEKGAQVNVTDSANDTPLTLAAARQHAQVVKLLLANGADPEAKNKRGETALSIATAKGFKEVRETLLSHVKG
ncbi:MAG: ankyrin repeat domain-containing protein [Thermodesulfobacteriota bacterium]